MLPQQQGENIQLMVFVMFVSVTVELLDRAKVGGGFTKNLQAANS